MNDDNQMTPERAERMTALGAQLSQAMLNAGDDMAWGDMFSALGLGGRGVAEIAARRLADTKGLPLEAARNAILSLAAAQIAMVFSMPSDLVRVVEGDGTGPVTFGTVPVARH